MTFPRYPVSPPTPSLTPARLGGWAAVVAHAARSRGQGSCGRCYARRVPPLEVASRQQRARSSPASACSRSCAPAAIAASSGRKEHRSGKKHTPSVVHAPLVVAWLRRCDLHWTHAALTPLTPHRTPEDLQGGPSHPDALPCPPLSRGHWRRAALPGRLPRRPSPAATSIRQTVSAGQASLL
jgi:hypothetical protein